MRIKSVLAASVLLSLPLLAPLLAGDPPALESGLGTLHHPVTTTNADAQRYFDQGLRYVYAFNHEQAVASFEHAAALDPDLAMAYWGKALALGPNINMDVDPAREQQAYAAVKAALAHASHGSPKERETIAALAKRYSADPAADLKQLSRDYSAAMRSLVAKYPDDLDLRRAIVPPRTGAPSRPKMRSSTTSRPTGSTRPARPSAPSCCAAATPPARKSSSATTSRATRRTPARSTAWPRRSPRSGNQPAPRAPRSAQRGRAEACGSRSGEIARKLFTSPQL